MSSIHTGVARCRYHWTWTPIHWKHIKIPESKAAKWTWTVRKEKKKKNAIQSRNETFNAKIERNTTTNGLNTIIFTVDKARQELKNSTRFITKLSEYNHNSCSLLHTGHRYTPRFSVKWNLRLIVKSLGTWSETLTTRKKFSHLFFKKRCPDYGYEEKRWFYWESFHFFFSALRSHLCDS